MYTFTKLMNYQARFDLQIGSSLLDTPQHRKISRVSVRSISDTRDQTKKKENADKP